MESSMVELLRADIRISLGLNPGSSTFCVTLGKLYSYSLTQFHICNRGIVTGHTIRSCVVNK